MKLKLLLYIFLVILFGNLHAQGCSDAGFCTISDFKPDSDDSTENYKNQLKIGSNYGLADNNIIAFSSYVEYSKELNKKFQNRR